jgi:inosine-uridine nucleoside N-ribohydrolase
MRPMCRFRFRFSVIAFLAAYFTFSTILAPAARATPPMSAPAPVIVDTDAGTDDLLALAFLLARSDVHIEAITVVNGMDHVPVGVANVLALLQLAGRTDIPVYAGSSVPLAGHAAFPAAWRKIAEDLPGVDLPKAQAKPQTESAVSFLVRRLSNSKRPVRILALGPLTNIGAALRQEPYGAQSIEELVIMGGAVRVPGNLGDGGVFKTENKTAEWNFFMDPLAASIVFGSKASIRLIPLDATQQVPIRADFVKSLGNGAKGTLEQFAAQVLASDDVEIREGYFYAWDPLAAVALVDRGRGAGDADGDSNRDDRKRRGAQRRNARRAPNARVGALRRRGLNSAANLWRHLAAAPAPKGRNRQPLAPAAKRLERSAASQAKSAAPAATAAPAAQTAAQPRNFLFLTLCEQSLTRAAGSTSKRLFRQPAESRKKVSRRYL